MEKLNVAIADDNEKMVEVLSKIIDQDEDLKLVGKAHNGCTGYYHAKSRRTFSDGALQSR